MGVTDQRCARAKFQPRKTCVLASHNDGWTWNCDEPIRSKHQQVPQQIVEKTCFEKISLLSREHTTEQRSYREDFKTFKMSTLTTNFVPQPAVYRASVDRSLKKSRQAKDVPLPEVPKVIDNGNGRRYFRGRLLGKVSFVSTMWFVWI